jgi:hypothetical protein
MAVVTTSTSADQYKFFVRARAAAPWSCALTVRRRGAPDARARATMTCPAGGRHHDGSRAARDLHPLRRGRCRRQRAAGGASPCGRVADSEPTTFFFSIDSRHIGMYSSHAVLVAMTFELCCDAVGLVGVVIAVHAPRSAELRRVTVTVGCL